MDHEFNAPQENSACVTPESGSLVLDSLDAISEQAGKLIENLVHLPEANCGCWQW